MGVKAYKVFSPCKFFHILQLWLHLKTEYDLQESVAGVKSTILCLKWTWTEHRLFHSCNVCWLSLWHLDRQQQHWWWYFDIWALWKPILSIPGRHRRLKWTLVPLTKHFNIFRCLLMKPRMFHLQKSQLQLSNLFSIILSQLYIWSFYINIMNWGNQFA